MKKKKINDLRLNKTTVARFKSEEIKGGAGASGRNTCVCRSGACQQNTYEWIGYSWLWC